MNFSISTDPYQYTIKRSDITLWVGITAETILNKGISLNGFTNMVEITYHTGSIFFISLAFLKTEGQDEHMTL